MSDASQPSDASSQRTETLADESHQGANAPRIGQGDSIGRYVVLELIGHGGMGRVYKAYDPKLGRAVALKLLRTNDPQMEQRAIREAQSMAALSHPNVVPVYDVDRADGRLYIAMEFIPGMTLRDWLKTRDSAQGSYRKVLRIMIQVGRGLAAAHDADLVHRDLKPSNIVLGDDGRTRVMDFGLARGSGVETETGDFSKDSSDATGPLTRMGTVLGTPSYMPPEQHRAGLIDARSDQFAYCVVFYEALFGHRPFEAEKLEALAQLKEQGLDAWPAEPAVPPWLARTIRKGLSPRAEGRFDSMHTLLAAIDHEAPGRSRKGQVLAAGGLAAVGLTALAWSLAADEPHDDDPCASAAAVASELWNDDVRTTVQQRLGAVALPFASDTADRATAALDDYAQRLADARHEACAATRVRGEQSEAMMNRRFDCLARAQVALRSTVHALSTPNDPTVVRNAVRTVLGLPDLDRCQDLTALGSAVPRPDDPNVEAEVSALEARLEEVRVKQRAGQHAQALADAGELLRSSERVPYGPVRAEALFVVGQLLSKRGEFEQARDTLQQAYRTAIESGHDEVAAHASAELTFVVGGRMQDHAQGQRHAEDSRAWATKLGTDEARARHENTYATLLQQMGRYAEAQRRFETVLELRERRSAPDALPVANALNNLGNVLLDQGKADDAVELYARAVRIAEGLFGPDHVTVGAFLNNLANAEERRGHGEQAWTRYERALSIFVRTYGEEHPDVAGFRMNMAAAAWRRGQLDDAQALYARALDVQRKVLDPEHPHLAQTLASYGSLQLERGEVEHATTLLEESLRINEAAYADDHPQVAVSLQRLAEVDLKQKAFAQAVERLERAAQIRATTESTEADRASGDFALARALAGRGALDRARITARRALTRTEDPKFRAEVQAWLEALSSDDASTTTAPRATPRGSRRSRP